MTALVRQVQYSYEEYLALEDWSPVRHEYQDGEIYAMAGGTPDHAALAGAVITLLGRMLPAGCRVYTSDLRVRVVSTGLSTYPDGTVVCGKTQRAPDDELAVTNPVLLVEVTSRPTESYDRGEKLRHYQTLESLREVLLVSHKGPHVTRHHRGDDGTWHMTEAGPGEKLELSCADGSLSVDELYREGLEDVP